MRKLNKLLVVSLGIILAFSIVSYSEKKSYIDEINQQGIDTLYSLGESLSSSINKVKEGEISGQDVLEYTLSSYSIEKNISSLSRLLSISPPKEDVKTIRNIPDNLVIHLNEGSTWEEFHQNIIQSLTYYVVAQIIARRGVTDFDIKQLKSAERLIELGKKAEERYESMVKIEEPEESS